MPYCAILGIIGSCKGVRVLDVKTYTTKEFAALINRETRTLYSWERSGKLIPKKDFNGRNIYTEEHLEEYYKPKPKEAKGV